MARKVDAFPEVVGQSTYPWTEWLDGGVWELEPSVDFKGKVETFRSNAIAHARRRGGRIKTRVIRGKDGGSDRLYIQFVSGPAVDDGSSKGD